MSRRTTRCARARARAKHAAACCRRPRPERLTPPLSGLPLAAEAAGSLPPHWRERALRAWPPPHPSPHALASLLQIIMAVNDYTKALQDGLRIVANS